MPRFQTVPERSLADQTRGLIVQRILNELLEKGEYGGPVIFETAMQGSPFTSVIVVWEGWRGIDPTVRSQMIAEAYREFEKTLQNSMRHIDPTRKQTINIPQVSAATAIGATYAEAVSQGLLPYKIVPPLVDGTDTLVRIQHAMKSFGLLPESPAAELLLPTKEMQEQAFQQLSRKFPDVTFWMSRLPEQE